MADVEGNIAAYARYRSVRFFGSLNGLRCLCILTVMWHHSPARVAMQEAPLVLLRGFVGVDFFFVLSGFLITTLLLREEARDGRFSLRGFYQRRILRIVPVYFLLVTLVSAYFIVVKGQGGLVELLPYYYLFLSNFLTGDIPLLSITWSLSVEEQYYLMWPLILMLLPAVGRVRGVVLVASVALCVASATGALSFLGVRPIETEHALWALPATGYAAILIGSLAAVVLHADTGFRVAWRLLRRRWTPVVLFAALCLELQCIPGALHGWPNLIMHLTMALCVMSIVIREDHVLSRAFQWRPVARIGEISYGLYLYHLVGRHVAVELSTRLGLDVWTMTLLFAVVSILIAEVSFRTYESYFLRLKHTTGTAPQTGG